MSNENSFNLNSLKWVKQEIDASLIAAREGLQRYAADSTQMQQLEASLGQLTDALGTLEIAEITGGALLAREIRDVLLALKSPQREHHFKDVDIVSRPVVRAMIQLSDYLGYIEAGNHDVPVVLINAINDLRLIRHAELMSDEIVDIPGLRSDEAVLSRQPHAQESIRDLAGVARHVFELGLLGWYRNKHVEASLNKMSIVCRRLKNASAHTASRRLWWVSEAIVAGLRAKVLPHSYSLKFLVGRIDRQIKQLQKVGDKQFAAQVPLPLIRTMLYYIASAHPGDPVLDEVREAYFTGDDEQAMSVARIGVGGQNAELYQSLAGALQEQVATIKDALELHALADEGADQHLYEVQAALQALAQTLQMLGMRHQEAFVLDHKQQLDASLRDGTPLVDADVDRLADMLIGVESAVQAFSMLGPNLIAAANEDDDRGQVGEVHELVADEEFRQIRATVIRESQENLEKCKAAFQQYAANPNLLTALDAVPKTLGQIAGAMLLVSEDRVSGLLDAVSEFVKQRRDAGKVINHGEIEHVAEAISAVDVYLEILDTSGIQQRQYLDRGMATVALLDVEADVEAADPTRMLEEDALLDEPSRLFNPETLIVDFKALDEGGSETVSPAEFTSEPSDAAQQPTAVDDEQEASLADVAQEVGDESMLFDAATLTIAGFSGEEQLDILDIASLDDDDDVYVARHEEDEASYAEDPLNASQLISAEALDDAQPGQDELLEIELDETSASLLADASMVDASPAAVDDQTQPALAPVVETAEQTDSTPASEEEAVDAESEHTQVVEVPTLDSAYADQESESDAGDEIGLAEAADQTQPIADLDLSALVEGFDEPEEKPAPAVEAVEPPTLTVSGIEVEELTSLDDEEDVDIDAFPPIRSDAEEELDTLAAMEIDDGLAAVTEGANLEDLVGDQDQSEFDMPRSVETNIGTASAFLFPDDSAAGQSQASLDDELDGDMLTGAAVLPEEVAPLQDVVEDAADLPGETGVRKLSLDEVVDDLDADVGEAVDNDVLTLVDILPDDEVVDFGDADVGLDAVVARTEENEEATTADNDVIPAAAAASLFDGLAVLKPGADEEIIEIFLEEFTEETAVLESHFPLWEEDPGRQDTLTTLRRSFHTLKGSARLVGAEVAGEFAWFHEKLLNEVMENKREATPDVISCVGAGIALLPRLLQQLQDRMAPDADIVAHAARIDSLLRGVAAQAIPEEVVAGDDIAEPDTLISALEDPALMEIFIEETTGNLATLDALLQQLDEGVEPATVQQELFRTIHTLNGSARTAKVPAVHQPSAAFERYLNLRFQLSPELPAADIDRLRDLHGHVAAALQAMRAGEAMPEAADLVTTLNALADALEPEVRQPAAGFTQLLDEASVGAQVEAPPVVEDAEESHAVSRELIEVFLDESEEILEHCDSTMQRWQRQPQDMELVRELYRDLHTLKGSARMAGLEQIGDLTHAVETLLTAVESGEVSADKSLFTVVFAALDRFGEMNEAVRAGRDVTPADALIELMTRIQQGQQLSDQDLVILKSGAGLEATASAAAEPDEVVAPPLTDAFESHLADLMPHDEGVSAEGEMLVSRLQDSVKVSPDLLDQFVDSVGEINILNSRVEQQNSAFGFNLQELERTISRLTDQLRQLEMEAEAQILHRFDGHHLNPDETGIDEYFDPLELDRYSTIQQLSRSLAESIDDLVSLHQLLSEGRRDMENLLQQESRVGNSLQEALMRTRMSPFKMMAPRLRRVVRGVALELGKEADFEITGEEQELDRKVLEGMVVPLEHLLRNALAHGIETPQQRLDAGKPEAGKITVSVTRDGPEVVIEVSDDGVGINKQMVRQRAIEKGIVSEDAELTDAEIHALILHPGFSTANEISQISGRGVGMDVVQEQLRHLNGLLEISSVEGQGTTFKIRLPFTLAINQSLLVRVGAHTYAVPINTVEGVVQISDKVLADKLQADDASIEYADRSYRLFRLDEVLENARLEPFQAIGETRPVLLVGSGEHLVALIVDEIEGNQDVVVKPIGGLLNSVPGLGGATILGDGQVVLILDTAGVVRAATGSRKITDIREFQAANEQNWRPTIMVVDDSITIRRVTEKMLERHHFNVVTAKDGLDAVARLEEVKPDMMLLDIEMPRMDGFELAAHMQGSEEHQDIPIIMISSRTGKKHRERAATLGVRGFLGKPYQDSELLQNIEAMLKQKEGGNRHVG